MAYTVTIRTSFEIEEQTDSMEMSYPCLYSYSPMVQVINYDEETEDGRVPTCVTVQPDCVDIVRSSPAMPDMHMKLGEVVDGLIQTPYGEIPITTSTTGVLCSMNPEGGEIKLDYSIDIGGNISKNSVCIQVCLCAD